MLILVIISIVVKRFLKKLLFLYDIIYWDYMINCGFIVYVFWCYFLISLEIKLSSFIRNGSEGGYFFVSF